ncbi:ABC transporter ATP-binding protein [Brachybacterium sacelli]|uniref:Iron complex transport system ATP-binding protein n=1 Tax=Brachybacterium sacelli TaxID=173364 RepID=A0ABS4WXV6_9MICO|nr:ATP-binding cassette domain-containing protein [Brachybacterium sacelli]MBP2380349.1 iron complex transport system ATP-binding protein [Brachybacterium sacelli]
MPLTPAPSVLDFTDVTYRRSGKTILPGVSFSIGRGEHWVMLGANGAGKSTILNLAGGTTHPTSGTVDVLGQRLGRVELRALRERIGHVDPRHPLHSALSIEDVILTGLTGSVERMMRWEPPAGEIARAHELLETFGLSGKADALWPTLSQGERGRTLVARALITSPPLLLLDEPSTGLDVAAREQLLETLETLPGHDPALTTLLVTHHLEEIPPTTTHALLLRDGTVRASGPIDDVLTSDAVSEAFEHPIAVGHDDGRWYARTRARRGSLAAVL